MFKNILIGALAIVVVALSAAVIRLENFHYAIAVGMCGQYKNTDPAQLMRYHDCLHKTSTRTNPLLHLYFGIIGE